MELLIERVPLEYEYKALKVLSVCEQYRMKDQGKQVGGAYLYLLTAPPH